MKLLVLNGITEEKQYEDFESALEENVLNNTKLDIEYFRLRDMNIHYCTGCWSCWMKTSGKCAIQDDFEQVLSRIPNADKILYVSPVILGYETALLKRCKDRSIPVIHPYIRIYKGELHHKLRYKKMPQIHVLLQKDENTTQKEIETIQYTYNRMALNFGSEVKQFEVIDKTGGVDHVFSRI